MKNYYFYFTYYLEGRKDKKEVLINTTSWAQASRLLNDPVNIHRFGIAENVSAELAKRLVSSAWR